MLSVRLSGDIEERLNRLSHETKRSKSHYVEVALARFLEDQEDYLLALSRLEQKGPNISLEEAKRQLGFLDGV
jgi:RHH-type rel operon transcriptional repressor/antitoxin RelB